MYETDTEYYLQMFNLSLKPLKSTVAIKHSEQLMPSFENGSN